MSQLSRTIEEEVHSFRASNTPTHFQVKTIGFAFLIKAAVETGFIKAIPKIVKSLYESTLKVNKNRCD